MKTMIFSVLMLFSTAYAGAEEARYLTVTTATQEKSVELATVQKITFTANNIIVHTTAGEILFPLSETEKMSFTATPASIGALPLQAEGLQYVNGQLIVHTPGLLRIYDAAGTLIQVAQVETAQTEVNLDNLAPGMYIVGIGDKTIKISK